MHDSPVGMLAWLAQRRREWGQTKDGDIESAFPREHILTTATLYWATECFASAARFYREAVLHPWVPSHDRTPRIERSEEHTSELQSLMRISYAVFCLNKNNNQQKCKTAVK